MAATPALGAAEGVKEATPSDSKVCECGNTYLKKEQRDGGCPSCYKTNAAVTRILAQDIWYLKHNEPRFRPHHKRDNCPKCGKIKTQRSKQCLRCSNAEQSSRRVNRAFVDPRAA